MAHDRPKLHAEVMQIHLRTSRGQPQVLNLETTWVDEWDVTFDPIRIEADRERLVQEQE